MTKKNWFDHLKRFFGSDPKTKQEKERKKRWIFGKFRSKFPPALPAPSLRRSRSLREAEQDQSKHAVAVAIATAAAAEAAVAAAQAAAQVVRLTGTPLSHHRAQEVAAIKIQTAFRGYLARKALQALKGLVKLQALVRGQTVRRQTTITLKGLQSLMNIQTRARASRVQAVKVYRTSEDREIYRRKAIVQPSSEKRWDGSSLSKEEINALLRNRREAAIKRERAMEYALYHQEKWIAQRPTTPTLIDKEVEYPDVADQRYWSWLEQWVGTQPLEKDIPEVFPTQHSDNSSKERVEENQLRYLARRSFNRSQKSTARDDDGFSSSPSFPSYMASTASTKARFRSMSTPKQRPGKTDASSDHYSPLHTDRILSPLSSIVSEIGNTGAHYQQRSPLGKGQAGPIKSHRSPNHLSFDSECSLLNWDRRDLFS